ncbi:hypothetical protein [Roseovarius indicus]|uniref:Uncharacterized protein n=1 Tax=Roseovarius indicus TaxID=540747 RepID=A0A0T5P3R7_9RHOB|nr:hypothetical protein [Roseovarius indicus]KRS15805.1 hypothetical protein XM52_21135 [Roseovarius indicus]OAO00687.1 hypothetical protein A8B76_17610 [Roseovarius indicus]QEW26480.1 hypothetical protein RIdsm_02280 [Roseovarius indicus]SFE62276.1 hypothetical protein SAMN04488031_1143 [Roseovarius indicus]
MILITRDDGPSGLAASVGLIERQLAEMRAEMEAIHGRIRKGELEGIKDAARVTADIRHWFKLALEAEVQFAKYTSEEKGIVRDYALDFSEARESIRGRLARLGRG